MFSPERPRPGANAAESAPVYSPESVSTASNDRREVSAVCKRGLSFTEEAGQSVPWTADSMIQALHTLDGQELQRVKTSLRCGSRVAPHVVIFYANPLNNPRGRLRIEQEMIETLELTDYTEHIFIVPVTTVNSFQTYLRRLRPLTFCFVGHSDEVHIAFCDECNRNKPVPLTTFCNYVRSAYGDDLHTLRTVCLFACKTGNLARELQSVVPHVAIVYWKTLTEDSASRLFAKSFLKDLLGRAEIRDAFQRAKSALIDAGMTLADPAPLLADRSMHAELFCQEIARVLATDAGSYEALSRFFYDGNPALVIEKRRFPTCTHCNPRVYGVPALLLPDGSDEEDEPPPNVL